MIKIIKGMCGVVAVMLLLASCMKSKDNNVTLASDTAITSFSLGTMKRIVHTTSSTGADSTYKVSVTGSDYKFSVDQVNHRIFNADSLPQGTDVSKVLCSVTALNNGGVFVEDLEEEGSLLFVSDSIDFSVPRKFRVYASDGSGYETYNVQVNVHQENGDVFDWTRHTPSMELAGMEELKAVILDGQLQVYGLQGDKTIGYATNDGEKWEKLPDLADRNAYSNMVVSDNVLYTLRNDVLISTKDGKTWTELGEAPVLSLVAASYHILYGLASDGNLMEYDVDGKEWDLDNYEAGANISILPVDETAYVCYPAEMTYYADYVLLAGTSEELKDIASVWRKIVEYDIQGHDDKWIYMDRNDDDDFALPQLKDLVMIYYDNSILAWGINGTDYSPVYKSRDNGLIWRKDSGFKLPEAFSGGNAAHFSAVTDGTEIWIMSAGVGEIYSGHLKRKVWVNEE